MMETRHARSRYDLSAEQVHRMGRLRLAVLHTRRDLISPKIGIYFYRRFRYGTE